MKESDIFSKDDTNIVKGIAIIAMIFHHTWKNNPELPIYMLDKPDIITVLAEAAKICVALLTILSGYGLSESYKKIKNRSVKNDIFFFLQHYLVAAHNKKRWRKALKILNLQAGHDIM